MSERIDHAAEAQDLIDVGIESMELKQLTHAGVTFALAQVRATLAFVEQQRIANLIALGSYSNEVSAESRSAEIREALGL